MEPELVIVGGGIGGCASALRACQYNIPTLWILGDSKTYKGSRVRWVANVDNMIGIHPDIILNKLKKSWKDSDDLLEELKKVSPHAITTMDIVNNVIDRVQEYGPYVKIIRTKVTKATKTPDGLFQVTLDKPPADLNLKDNTLITSNLILSTGIMDRQPFIYKEKDGKVQAKTNWIYPFANQESILYCIRCEGHLTHEKKAAVIGNSEVTAQIALILKERYNSLGQILTNGEPTEFHEDTQKLLDFHEIKIVPEKIVDILGSPAPAPKGHLNGFVLENGNEVLVDFAFVSLGLYKVYNELARDLSAKLNDNGHPDTSRVLIDVKGETSVPNLFAVGDMAVRDDERVMMQIYTAQEYAVRAVDTIEQRIRKKKREEILKKL